MSTGLSCAHTHTLSLSRALSLSLSLSRARSLSHAPVQYVYSRIMCKRSRRAPPLLGHLCCRVC